MSLTNRTNYHSHCNFCDGRSPIDDFLQAALAEGFYSYGVSSHAPLPFPTPWSIERSQVQLYLREIARLRELYADRIELYAGLEIDYLDDESNPANDYFQSLPLDFRIGSVHLLYTSSGELIDIDASADQFQQSIHRHWGGDLRRVVTDYYDKLMRMVETGGFDFIGHADKISHNASQMDPEVMERPWYRQKIEEYCSLIAQKGVMVEVNTKAFDKYGRFFPDQCYFKRLVELEVPLLVNSDAHRTHLINSGREEALDALLAAGATMVMELHDHRWQATPIRTAPKK